jgi:putative membrane protein
MMPSAEAWSAYLAAFALSLASLFACARGNTEAGHRFDAPLRLLGFIVAALALALTLASPLDELASHRFSAHMIEHVLFLYTIPLALVAAQPLPVAVREFRRLPLSLRRSFGRRVWRNLDRLNHPIPAFMLSALTLWVWHTPPLYDLALRSQTAHVLEHASFLGTSILYWRQLLNGRRSAGALNSNAKRALYLIAGGMQGGLLGAFIALSDHVIYTGYLLTPQASLEAALADQQLGGAIMWFSGPVFCGVLAALVMR